MTQVLQATIKRLKALPNADQEHIASQINDYLTRLEHLRELVQEGLESGPATPLDMDDIIRRGEARLAALQHQTPS